MIQAIVFDLGGVIFSSDGTTHEGREKLAEKWGVSKERIHEIWNKHRNDLLCGRCSEETYLLDIQDSLKILLSIEELKEDIRSLNKTDNDMLLLVTSLKNRHRLAVLNNEVKEWNEYRINTFNLRSYFPLIVSSCDVGAAKPDKKIYQILLEKLNCDISEVVFIDDRKENVVAASELGIQAVQFKGKDSLIADLKRLGVF